MPQSGQTVGMGAPGGSCQHVLARTQMIGEGVVSEISQKSLSWSVARTGNALHLLLEGDANMTAVEEIGRILDDLDESSRREPTATAVVDVRGLEFMNSSCFKKFVTWIGRVQELAAEAYKVRFLSDPKLHWQRRSLHVLQCFAPELVTVET